MLYYMNFNTGHSFSPHIHTHSHTAVGTPPSFINEPPASVIVSTGQLQQPAPGVTANLVVPCGATGNPTPTITWFREDQLLDAALVLPDGTLAINVTEDDTRREGTIFRCVATNRIGENSTTVAALRSRNVNVTLTCEWL